MEELWNRLREREPIPPGGVRPSAMNEDRLPAPAPSDDRADRIAQALAGALTNGVAAALGMWGGPVGTVAVTAAGAAVQGTVERRMLALLRLCERASGPFGENMLRESLSRPERASLVLDAADAIARSGYEAKVETIARAIANGMLYEDDVRFDVEATITRTIMALDPPHVAILIELREEYLNDDQLTSRLAQYALVLPALLNELRRLGLTEGIHEDPESPGLVSMGGHKLTEFGREVRQRFQSAADALKQA